MSRPSARLPEHARDRGRVAREHVDVRSAPRRRRSDSPISVCETRYTAALRACGAASPPAVHSAATSGAPRHGLAVLDLGESPRALSSALRRASAGARRRTGGELLEIRAQGLSSCSASPARSRRDLRLVLDLLACASSFASSPRCSCLGLGGTTLGAVPLLVAGNVAQQAQYFSAVLAGGMGALGPVRGDGRGSRGTSARRRRSGPSGRRARARACRGRRARSRRASRRTSAGPR